MPVPSPASIIDERFVLSQEWKRGGMGVVWKARDLKSDRTVALKLLHDTTPLQVERFVRESALLAGLSHPGIVSYIAHGATANGTPYLTMEWLEGENLAERLGLGPLSLHESLALLRSALSGLSVAHRRGIVHRDVKPSNLFLRSGRLQDVVLLDLGLARHVASSHELTRSGSVLGTPSYMPPEQAQGRRDLGPAADVFSLGCVLFECLTGQPPFVGAQLVTVLAKVLFERAPRLRELRPELPEPIDALIARMLDKDPGVRPQDAAALLALLDAQPPLPEIASRRPSASPQRLGAIEQELVSVLLALPDAPPAPLGAAVDASTLARDPGELPDVSAYGGELRALADGALVITLAQRGGAANDLAARAARCALALSARWPSLGFALATGRGIASEHSYVGEAVDRAGIMLRAQAASSRGSIWLDEVTAGLLGASFQTERLEEGIVVFELLGEAPSSDPARPLLGRPTRCVGRETELGMLQLALAGVIEESSPRALLVLAAPGIGKSRLRHEFLRSPAAQSAGSLLALGDPIRTAGGCGLLGRALLRFCEVRDGATLDEQRAALEARAGRHLGPDKQRTLTFLAELCGLRPASDALPELHAARQSPVIMADLLKLSWCAFLRAEAAIQPLVIVLDDLQWSDALSVTLVGAALRELASCSPILVLAFGRPETVELYPELWAPRLTSLPLQPLGTASARRFVRQALGERTTDESVERIVKRAGGNALFLEELIRAADAKRDAVPQTVVAMLQARIGLLPAAARRVLRAASVFGESFSRAGLEALLSDAAASDIELALSLLIRHEIVEPHSNDRARFRHALMCDAAYGLLTPEDRSASHALAAQYLARSGEDSAVIAAHHERSGDLAAAVQLYIAAAEQASERRDLPAIIALVARGLACGAQGVERGVLRSLEAPARYYQYDFGACWTATSEALALLPTGHPRRIQSLASSNFAALHLGKSAEVETVIEELLASAPSEGDRASYVGALGYAAISHCVLGNRPQTERLLARIAALDAALGAQDPYVRGQACYWRMRYLQLLGDDPYECMVLAERGAPCHELAGDRRMLACTLIEVGECARRLRSVGEGLRAMRVAVKLAQEIHDPDPAVFVQQYLATLLAEHGALTDLPEAEALARSTVSLAGDGVLYRALALISLALAALRKPDLAAAESCAREAHQTVHRLGMRSYFAHVDAALLKVLSAMGRTAEAGELAQSALRSADELAPIGLIELSLRLCCVRALLAVTRTAEAERALGAALETLARRAAHIPDAAMRECFLRDVPENAALVALGAELGVSRP